MSLHCLFCGGQNPPKGMIYDNFIRVMLDEYLFFNKYGDDAMVFPKLELGYAHDCCLIKVLVNGQEDLMGDGELIDFSAKIKQFGQLITDLANRELKK